MLLPSLTGCSTLTKQPPIPGERDAACTQQAVCLIWIRKVWPLRQICLPVLLFPASAQFHQRSTLIFTHVALSRRTNGRRIETPQKAKPFEVCVRHWIEWLGITVFSCPASVEQTFSAHSQPFSSIPCLYLFIFLYFLHI